MNKDDNRVTGRSLILGMFFAGLFSVLTLILDHRRAVYIVANQVPLFPYILLILTVVLINPLLKLIRVVRRFTRTELLIVFVMGMVSAGIASFGLAGEWLPLVGSLFNRHWNNDQTEWNLYVEPFLNEHYFVSEPGIRAAAREYREAVMKERALTRTYETALSRQRKIERGHTPPPPLAEDHPLAQQGLPPLDEILRSYPERIDRQRELSAERKQALGRLEARAFEKVEVFRRGLPRELRAFPGCLPVFQQDDSCTYFGRLRRLFHGRRSAMHIRQAVEMLKSSDSLAETNRARVADLVRKAAEALTPIADSASLKETEAELRRESEELGSEIMALTTRIRLLSEEKREARLDRARELDREITSLSRRGKSRQEAKKKVAFTLERRLFELEVTDKVTSAKADLESWCETLTAQGTTAAKARTALTAILVRFPSFDASLRRYFLGDIPWTHWVGPLLRWLVLITLTYVVLMTFNVLIFRQWAHNEKIIYPLAELPELLSGDEDDQHHVVPKLFRSGLFWVGFAISASVLTWNLLCKAGALPGMNPIDLANSWSEYIRNTKLQSLGGLGRSSIFFTMIGVAFLIPKKVSFSLWFFWLLGLLQLLLLVWTGYGQGSGSFPSEWWYTLNFRTAEGSGALLVFASVVLWKSRRYILCALLPSSVRDLEADERTELRVSSLLFLTCSLGIVLTLWRGLGVNVFYAMFTYAVMMTVTIGLVRAVSEGGILSYKSYFGPFHLIRHIFGFDKSWTSPSLMAPLMTFYSLFFLDIKAFIAPAMANSLKIRADLRVKRGKFHLAVALGIVTAVLVCILAALMMCYAQGADAMSRWFYTGFPRGVFARIADMSKSPPMPTAAGRLWLSVGAIVMAALLFFRQRIFWLPHPIGLIMLVNPIMRTFWFSIFVGWIAKTLMTKYGNKDTYARARGLFVGLIVGELVVVMIAMIVSLVIQQNLQIDLNRN